MILLIVTQYFNILNISLLMNNWLVYITLRKHDFKATPLIFAGISLKNTEIAKVTSENNE